MDIFLRLLYNGINRYILLKPTEFTKYARPVYGDALKLPGRMTACFRLGGRRYIPNVSAAGLLSDPDRMRPASLKHERWDTDEK